MSSSIREITKNVSAQINTPLRFITAASLFDGHDAAINIMRRILQSSGVEVIHLAHNRSVREVIESALQEDVDGIAISSYQGGHVEYFKYIIDMLKDHGAGHIKVFGGGGGVIVPDEINELHEYGITRIYSPQDGQALGLQGMIDDMLSLCSADQDDISPPKLKDLSGGDRIILARFITGLENGQFDKSQLSQLEKEATLRGKKSAVLGITGTGGAGKSSLTDEVIRRFRLDSGDEVKIAVLAIDPTRRRTGGALLGDRIRMNAIYNPNIYMRSVATRSTRSEVPEYLPDIINALKLSGFDGLIVETPGIGQGQAGLVP